MELGRSGHRRALAGAVGLAAVAALAGCGGHGGDGGTDTPFTPPGPGQAVILLTADQAGSGLDLNTIRSDDGMAFAPDGSLYVLRTDLFRVSPGRAVSRVWRAGPYTTSGLAALPDGALAVGVRNGILRVGTHGKVSTLAGSPEPPPTKDGKNGKTAAPGAKYPPDSGSASSRLAGMTRPLGTRTDGALLAQDVNGIWAAKAGTLTKVLGTPVDPTALNQHDAAAAVRPTADAAGDAYFMASHLPLDGLTGRITRVTPAGAAAKVPVPRTIPGVSDGTDRLAVQSMAGDGADGVYVDALDDNPGAGLDSYVLHLYHGTARVVAHSHISEHGLDCTLRDPVSALKLPCALPHDMAYAKGKLVLDGMVHYTLEIAVS